jgi:pimeloyl-ACP methyl ester carboxylesterase
MILHGYDLDATSRLSESFQQLQRESAGKLGLVHVLADAGHQAIAINMRGAEGSSGPFDHLSTDMMVDDVAAVARTLGLGRFHILGHALGGRLARYFAARHSDAVRTVITLAGSGRQVVPVDYTRLSDAVTRTLAGSIAAREMD